MVLPSPKSSDSCYVLEFPRYERAKAEKELLTEAKEEYLYKELPLSEQIRMSLVSHLYIKETGSKKIIFFDKDTVKKTDYPKTPVSETDKGYSYKNFELIFITDDEGKVTRLDIRTLDRTYTLDIQQYDTSASNQAIHEALLYDIAGCLNLKIDDHLIDVDRVRKTKTSLTSNNQKFPFSEVTARQKILDESRKNKEITESPSANTALRVLEGFCKVVGAVALLAIIGFLIAGHMDLISSSESWVGVSFGGSAIAGLALARFGVFAHEKLSPDKGMVPENVPKTP